MSNEVAKVNPFVPTEPVFIVVPLHSRGVVGWDGPYATKEKAQEAAARAMLQSNWMTCSVFQLVGTVARPAPDLTWNELEKSS